MRNRRPPSHLMELRHLPGEVLALAGDPDGVDPIPSDLADNCNYWYRTANYYELLSTAKLLQLRGLLLGPPWNPLQPPAPATLTLGRNPSPSPDRPGGVRRRTHCSDSR